MREYAAQIRRLSLVWLLAFAILAGAAGYWQVIAAPALQRNPANARAEARRSLTQPGNIYAADGTTLILGSKRENGVWEASYPEPEVFCHLTGYNQRSGLQWGLQQALRGEGRFADPWQMLLTGRLRGCDVKLTIDAAAQRIAAQALRGHRGAIVALDPRDGAIRVLASAPAYDPASLSDPGAFTVFTTDPFSPELDRALMGLYTPGSALKIMTASIALDTHAVTTTQTFSCTGADVVNGSPVRCPEAHGTVNMDSALAKSCNIYFAHVGAKIGGQRFRDYTRKFHLLDDSLQAWLPLPGKSGRMADLLGPRGAQLLVHTAYGQGETMVTPLAMARLTATIARGGTVPQPYLVSEIMDAEHHALATAQPTEWPAAIRPGTASLVAGMMSDVVEKGTAGIMRIPGVRVAAKTGTAQRAHGKPDVWMLAFAPVDHPVVAIAVVIEEGESGSETAGPAALAVMRALLGR
jgi:peptidoglycan glycosyltransferase